MLNIGNQRSHRWFATIATVHEWHSIGKKSKVPELQETLKLYNYSVLLIPSLILSVRLMVHPLPPSVMLVKSIIFIEVTGGLVLNAPKKINNTRFLPPSKLWINGKTSSLNLISIKIKS